MKVLVPPRGRFHGSILKSGRPHSYWTADTTLYIVDGEKALVFRHDFQEPILHVATEGQTVILMTATGFSMIDERLVAHKHEFSGLSRSAEVWSKVFWCASDSTVFLVDRDGMSLIASIYCGPILLYEGTELRATVLAADGTLSILEFDPASRSVERRTLATGLDVVSVQWLDSRYLLVSERAGFHVLWSVCRDSDRIIWSLCLGEGSACCFLTSEHIMGLDEGRRELLGVFKIVLAYTTCDGELTVFGVQQTSNGSGQCLTKGEVAFSQTLSPVGGLDTLMPMVIGGKLHFVMQHNRPYLAVLRAFADAQQKATYEIGSLVEDELLGDCIISTEGCWLTVKGETVKAFKCPVQLNSVSSLQIEDRFCLFRGRLYDVGLACGKDEEAVLRAGQDALHIFTSSEVLIEGLETHELGPETLGSTVDVALCGDWVTALVLSKDRLKLNVHKLDTMAIVYEGQVDGSPTCLVDCCTGQFPGPSPSSIEFAPVFDDSEHLFEPFLVDMTTVIKFKRCSFRGEVIVAVLHADRFELLAKRFLEGKIRWTLLYSFPVDCASDFFLMEHCLLLVEGGAIFQETIDLDSLVRLPRPAADDAVYCGLLAGDLSLLAAHSSHPFARLALEEQRNNSGHDIEGLISHICLRATSQSIFIPTDLVHISWLNAHLSDCQETVTEAACKGLVKKGLLNNIDLVSVLYFLMGKEKTLLALWRTSQHPDSDKVVGFLKDAIDGEKRKVAEKTAFVLLGRQRHHLAIFFFLLAGSACDASMVCMERLRDPCLSALILRLGSDGPADNMPLILDRMTAIEGFLFKSALCNEQDWDLLLAQGVHRPGEWAVPTGILKGVPGWRHSFEYSIEDVKELWSRHLYGLSRDTADRLHSYSIKLQLCHWSQ